MPQKKTRTAKSKHKNKTKTVHSKKSFYRTPTPYPFSPGYPTRQINGAVTTSSSLMRAVSSDGQHWDVDTDVNGVKKHANLTNSQIMDILAYPAAKQDLKTRLLREFHNIQQPPQQPQIVAQNFGVPIIRMIGPIEEPKIEYIYKRGCTNYNNPNNPIMLNKLSPLHEAKIVPESSGEPIHLVPMHTSRSVRKVRGKGKGKGKGRGESKKQNGKR
jgi:hypothetical protein